jgi:general secretion pathway protein G
MNEPANQPDREQAPPPNEASMRLKLGMALLVGLVTAAAGGLTGIYALRQPYSWVCHPQQMTIWTQMWSLANSLNKYKEEHGAYPLTLEDMTSEWKGLDEKPLEKMWIDYKIQDGWKNPMTYASDGKTWELLSYGADGKPGGIGLDADICYTETDTTKSSRSYLYKDATPTIEQVIRSKAVNETIAFSALVGIVSFIATMRSMFVSFKPKKTRSEVILTGIGLTIVTSILVWGLITIQSIASGH